MKSTFALALTAFMSEAAITIVKESSKECWFNEGATYVKACEDIFYWYCDEYTIDPESSCIVRTFSDSIVQWSFSEVEVAYWPFGSENQWEIGADAQEGEAAANGEETSFDTFVRDLGDYGMSIIQNLLIVPEPRPDTHEKYDDWVDPFSEGCKQLTTGPITYDQEAPPKLNYLSGMCGFKIQFTNNHPNQALTVFVKRDAASTLFATAAALAATVALAF